MAMRIVASRPDPAILTLPWDTPLEEWPDDVVVPLPRGLRMVRADRTIAPKGTGVIRVALDTFSADPKGELVVRATTNDPDVPEFRVIVKAEVRAYLALSPHASRITFVQFGAEGGTRHVLAATDGEKFEVTGVESSLDYITAKFRELNEQRRRPDGQGDGEDDCRGGRRLAVDRVERLQQARPALGRAA